MSQVTQQNAASSEELATSASEMSSQAKQLMQTMSFFNIDQHNSNDRDSRKPLPITAKKSIEKPHAVIIDLEDNDALDEEFVKF